MDPDPSKRDLSVALAPKCVRQLSRNEWSSFAVEFYQKVG